MGCAPESNWFVTIDVSSAPATVPLTTEWEASLLYNVSVWMRLPLRLLCASLLLAFQQLGAAMRVTIEHREHAAGVTGMTRNHYVDCTVEFSEEEKPIVGQRGLSKESITTE